MPFVAALVVALALAPLRLGGLAMLAAFVSCAYFVFGFQISPLTSIRKVLLLVVAAPAVGLLVDFSIRRARTAAVFLCIVAVVAALWAFWPVITSRPAAEAWRLGVTAALASGFMVVFAHSQLASDGIRAGAAALAVGLGAGIAAIIGASAALGLQGIALGAGAGAFLLPQMIRGKRYFAGATFTVTAMLAGSLVAVAAMVLAQLPWYSVLLLALVPAAARLPLPHSAPLWLQAVLCSLYSFVVAGVACALAWPSSQ